MQKKIILLFKARLPLSAVAFFYVRHMLERITMTESVEKIWGLVNSYTEAVWINITKYIFLFTASHRRTVGAMDFKSKTNLKSKFPKFQTNLFRTFEFTSFECVSSFVPTFLKYFRGSWHVMFSSERGLGKTYGIRISDLTFTQRLLRFDSVPAIESLRTRFNE